MTTNEISNEKEINKVKLLPNFLTLNRPIIHDDSVERTELEEIYLSSSDMTTLNKNSSQLIFKSDCSFLYYLSSPYSGFKCTIRFITKTGVNNDRNADITLANNFFGHLFSEVLFKIKGVEIERIQNFGISQDMLYNLESQEFKQESGQLLTFIPDS